VIGGVLPHEKALKIKEFQVSVQQRNKNNEIEKKRTKKKK
jgi:hypothetical protein